MKEKRVVMKVASIHEYGVINVLQVNLSTEQGHEVAAVSYPLLYMKGKIAVGDSFMVTITPLSIEPMTEGDEREVTRA